MNVYLVFPFLLILTLVLVFGPLRAFSSTENDADYFLDETLFNNLDRGEVERLLRDYPSNQDLIRSVGNQYYQIVNVVQLRHHQFLDTLNTREGLTKGTRSQSTNIQGIQAMQQQRTGKHFHRTSFLIQAFNHKFRLILELNPTLIAPNVLQKHIFSENAEQKERNELESCYYHGNVEGLEWSAAAVRTCNGLSGIIHMGNETFIIHPFYGGDLSNKMPHIVYEVPKSTGRQTCGNQRGFEWTIPFGSQNSDFARKFEDKVGPQYFIELALILDKQMFEKRNGSSRLQVVHDALQIVNIADMYFRKLNTAISVVYVETWQKHNHLQVAKIEDLRQTLVRLTDFYGPRNLNGVNKDTTMLISGIPFAEAGMGYPSSICTNKAMGIVTDVSIFQPHISGVALAHMIGHNLNMPHDQDIDTCRCDTWYGCIMSGNIVGASGIQPYRFSECSRKAYFGAINSGHAMCLINKPNAIDTAHKTCGNDILDSGEECDDSKDPCCERMTCRLKTTAQCPNSSPCCENCKFKPQGSICRPAASSCDIAEQCTGQSPECPMNVYKKNGASCGNDGGYCFNGFCPTHDAQCKSIWDWNGKVANRQCFEHFNVGGHHNGHCGRDVKSGNYRRCSINDVMCGTLHCSDGSPYPTSSISFQNTTFSKISLKLQGIDYECKNLNGGRSPDQLELVRDGTRCGKNMICMNQTCVKLSNYIDTSRCPTNHIDLECSGHGDCSSVNSCHCFEGWEGKDCSVVSLVPPRPTKAPEVQTPKIEAAEDINQTTTTTTSSTPGKIRGAGQGEESSNTIVLVFGMVSVVGGVFILFALLALCYRRSTVPKFDAASYPAFNPKAFKLPPSQVPLAHQNIDNRILSLAQLPSYRLREQQQQQNIGMTGSMKNLGNLGSMSGMGNGGAPADEEALGDETSAFLGTPINRFQPEKGILKKFEDDNGSQSDNNEGICEVERTLKSLNGYHDDILAALRVAAAQRNGHDDISPQPQGMTHLSDGYPDYSEFGNEFPLLRGSNEIPHNGLNGQDREEDSNEDTGPIRIRNLEDLLRQLEHHSSGRSHLSPCGSEDIRMSETEADRHYRLHSAELGGNLGGGGNFGFESDDESGFVFGRYRSPGIIPSKERNTINTRDYSRFTSAQADTPDDMDLESNQTNLINSQSSSDEDEDYLSHIHGLTSTNVSHLLDNPTSASTATNTNLNGKLLLPTIASNTQQNQMKSLQHLYELSEESFNLSDDSPLQPINRINLI